MNQQNKYKSLFEEIFPTGPPLPEINTAIMKKKQKQLFWFRNLENEKDINKVSNILNYSVALHTGLLVIRNNKKA